MAIIHLFGGGFRVGDEAAGYIINDAKALGAGRLHEHSPQTIASRAKACGRTDSQHEGRNTLDSREREIGSVWTPRAESR